MSQHIGFDSFGDRIYPGDSIMLKDDLFTEGERQYYTAEKLAENGKIVLSVNEAVNSEIEVDESEIVCL